MQVRGEVLDYWCSTYRSGLMAFVSLRVTLQQFFITFEFYGSRRAGTNDSCRFKAWQLSKIKILNHSSL